MHEHSASVYLVKISLVRVNIELEVRTALSFRIENARKVSGRADRPAFRPGTYLLEELVPMSGVPPDAFLTKNQTVQARDAAAAQ